MKHDLKALRDLEKRLAEAKGGHDDDAIIERRAINAWVHDNLMPEPKVVIPLNYTTSLDAAIALVERALPDWHLCVQGVNDSWSARLNPTAFGKVGDGFANHATPALALCLACVRALIAQGEVTP